MKVRTLLVDEAGWFSKGGRGVGFIMGYGGVVVGREGWESGVVAMMLLFKCVWCGGVTWAVSWCLCASLALIGVDEVLSGGDLE
ncbi:hypothetical protein Tco_0665153 [Tanacetum coccineum]